MSATRTACRISSEIACPFVDRASINPPTSIAICARVSSRASAFLRGDKRTRNFSAIMAIPAANAACRGSYLCAKYLRICLPPGSQALPRRGDFSGIALNEFEPRCTMVAAVACSNAVVLQALFIESSGASFCGQDFLGFEVAVETAMRQPRLGHRGRDAHAVDTILPK